MRYRRLVVIVSALLAAAVLASGCGLLREPEEVSAPIEAIPLELDPVDEASVAEPTAELASDESTTDAPDGEIAEPETAEASASTAGAGLRIFVIDPAASQVRFELDEELRGVPTTVVGVTNELAGELAFDLDDLSTTQTGVIQINARGLVTDNNFRNRAIHNEILHTAEFEFITFEPTAVEGLPDSAAVGDVVQFTIDGNLTIRDVTRPATFNVEATITNENQITGRAATTITRTDYNLIIPNVRNVANVEEVIELYIDFTANAS